jgi:potassium-dependent mechanosensitive channel
LRLLGQIGLLAWTAYFLRIFYVNAFDSSLSEYQWFENIRPVVIAVGLAVVLTGILAEVPGYGGMAVLWFSGLWRTSLVLVWAYILFGFLKESDVYTYIEKSDDLSEDEFEEQPYPARWLIVRVMRLALAASLIFSLPLLWGADRTFLADIFYAINFRVRIGDFEFSTMGIVYAALVFLIIHTVSVIWKSVLRDRILKESDMEEGRKDSLTRISVYGLWAVGIMIAMPMMGISGTSLAVVFGAVGIGLGFGLQNIFKDFISGIILLFERPIQVGDTVEIDGMWGIVKEINVRATYVKTYDNSDLIIPNADFISRTVINWTFRDPRLRRRIQVRVAYGSDIKLVKETLMNIAYKHPRVLRRPYPEVYFMDLGESAMLFELRVWLHIDYFIIVETEVRDDISSQFRELGIRIAFPQQDIYIRETPSSFAAVNDPFVEQPPVFEQSST